MQVGSLVQSLIDWEGCKKAAPGVVYPNKGDILTIKKIEEIEDGFRNFWFEEGYFGVYGYLSEIRFQEVQEPVSIIDWLPQMLRRNEN